MDDLHERFLSWRNVDDPCQLCGGAGVRVYGSSSTWRGGYSGQMMTSDVCDVCWGTGDKRRKGTDLRRLNAFLSKMEHVKHRLEVTRDLGTDLPKQVSLAFSEMEQAISIMRGKKVDGG